MDGKCIGTEAAIGKIVPAFGMAIDRMCEDSGGRRGDMAYFASDYFMGMLAGCLLRAEDSVEEISRRALGDIATMGIVTFSRDEETITRFLQMAVDGKIGKR